MIDIDINDIGKLIRQLRKERGFTLERLSEALECDVTTISRIERGQTEPSALMFEKIMTFFGMNPNETYELWTMARDYNMI